MQHSVRKTFYVFASAIISVFLHLVLLGLADRLHLDAFSKVPTEDFGRPRQRVSIFSLRERMSTSRPSGTDDEQANEELLKFVREQEVKVRGIFREHKLEMAKPKPRLLLAGLGKNVVLPPALPPVMAPREAEAPRPSILEIDYNKLPPERQVLPRKLSQKTERKVISDRRAPSLVAGSKFRTGVGSTINLGMKLNLPPGAPMALGKPPPSLPPFVEPEPDTETQTQTQSDQDTKREKKPTREIPAPKVASLPDLPTVGITKARERITEVKVLDTLLTVTMQVYDRADGSGIFRIDISPNLESERLRSVPKDVVFLVDCSTSISAQKLAYFKQGVSDALEYLNKGDRFNVVSFRTKAEPLFANCVPTTPENVEQARRHVRSLMRGGMTDVHAGLHPFVEQERDPQRPLNLFLLTDGQSTVKNKLQNDELIRRIVSLNRSGVSIYSFSAGRKANLFLLDFLAYNNRGASLHQDEVPKLPEELVRFIATHSELIVSDLGYHVTGGLGGEIYPKNLPHLYRGETLSVYGKFSPGTEEVAVSVVGVDANGQEEELIYRGNVRKAEKGNAGLQLDWASQKIYHLISENTLKPSEDAVKEIRRLSIEHNLIVPYF